MKKLLLLLGLLALAGTAAAPGQAVERREQRVLRVGQAQRRELLQLIERQAETRRRGELERLAAAVPGDAGYVAGQSLLVDVGLGRAV